MTKFVIKKVYKHHTYPFISIVISVLNEQNRISSRIDNLLGQQYPTSKMEIIVVSDGSTDRTVEIIRSYSAMNVRLLELPERRGKAFAVNLGVAEARGGVIIFADARQSFTTDGVAQLVANFSDPSVGCVSGELMFLVDADSDIQAEMGAYWNYEKWIRKMESATGSVVGATGSIYAVRKKLYKPLPEGTLLDDVLTPLNVVMQGYRCIFDGSAVAYDAVSKNTSQEWSRKVRTLAGNWQLLSLNPSLAFPNLNPLWWRFLSHKIFRLLIPFVLLMMFVLGRLLSGRVYIIITTLQIVFYSVALLGACLPLSRKIRFINLSYVFVAMNAAAVAGFWKWLTGDCSTVWTRSNKRPVVI